MAPTRAKRPAKGHDPALKQAKSKSGQAKDTLALKVEYVDWLFDPDPLKGSQAEWADAHGVHPVTVSKWRNGDEVVLGLIAEQEVSINRRWALILRRQEQIALTGRPSDATAAATFLAKAMGKFKAEKHEISGRMSLADFLAAGGYTQEVAQPRARIN